jgi:hypothetical protein
MIDEREAGIGGALLSRVAHVQIIFARAKIFPKPAAMDEIHTAATGELSHASRK